MPGFDVVRLNLFGRENIQTTDGAVLSEGEWAEKLSVVYAPTIIFFDGERKEAVRIESDIQSPHLLGAMRYVSTGAYRTQPSFQHFIREHYNELASATKEARER